MHRRWAASRAPASTQTEQTDVWLMPAAPFERDASAEKQAELTLIPYGSAKQFRVSMFPYLK